MSADRNTRDEMSSAYQAELRAELISTINGTRAARVPRKAKMAGVGVVAAVVLGSGAGFAYSQISSAPVTDHTQARCYTTTAAGVNGDDFPGTTVAVADGSSVSDALTACADLWRQGVLRAGGSNAQAPDPDGTFPVPQLTACVLDNGQAAIVPGTAGTCHSLGLVPETAH